MSNNKLKKIAEETIEAINAEKYTTPSGKIISIKKSLAYSIKLTKLYKPNGASELEEILNYTSKISASPDIFITRESTLEAAARLASENPCILNFASAKNAGGGFLRGSAAQEESIARSSALYPTLIRHPEYYEENKRSQKDNIGLYLDYAIYSPRVVVFRNDAGDWLEDPYVVSILTSPAPNRSAIMNDEINDIDDATHDETKELEIQEVLDRRMRQILSIMAAQGHRTIILGAWGCGVFGNDPLLVAELFKENLTKLPFFDNVIFAIYDKVDSEAYLSFSQVFG
jgi:uncharacterized protein (TIGR02452 family)